LQTIIDPEIKQINCLPFATRQSADKGHTTVCYHQQTIYFKAQLMMLLPGLMTSNCRCGWSADDDLSRGGDWSRNYVEASTELEIINKRLNYTHDNVCDREQVQLDSATRVVYDEHMVTTRLWMYSRLCIQIHVCNASYIKTRIKVRNV